MTEIIKKESDKSTDFTETKQEIKINDEIYTIALKNNLKESQEQTVFYMNQLQSANEHYNQIISEKNDLIEEITQELEEAKKQLTSEVTKRNIDKDLERFRKNFTRFGMDLYFIGGIPISEWIENKKVDTNFNSYSFGLGLNLFIMNKINLRATGGIEYQNVTVNPQLGFSVGYFF